MACKVVKVCERKPRPFKLCGVVAAMESLAKSEGCRAVEMAVDEYYRRNQQCLTEGDRCLNPFWEEE